jgi:hypothetical protein
MKDLQYQCCFCGESIVQSQIDPCAVILVGNWQSSKPAEQADQQFFCHVACFKKAMWHNVPVEIEGLVADRIEEGRGAS